ncbi:MAG: chemotaxis response regulator protein-glutamate methylesterase [Blastocatellia bacterium]
MDQVLRVLVVDDSAYVRKAIKQMLSRSPFLEVVGIARDGQEALELVEQLRPDVVTCDLIMPVMDGVSFVREQMSRRPLPIVVVSIANEGSEMALAALDLGAVDFAQKPTALATEKIYEVSDELIEKVKAAAGVPMARLQAVLEREPPRVAALRPKQASLIDIIVLGISTGGPQALKHLIPQLPADFPVPIVIVMHMPVGYTEMYAQKLNEISELKVSEAHEGDLIKPGSVLLAPAGRHLTMHRQASDEVVIHLSARPFDAPHRPSVDVMFQSAAEVYGNRTMGVVMTGMGADGKQGAAWIKSQGGMIFTEAEQSCVVYGMPGSVVEAGLSDKSIPLEQMAQSILEVV